MAVGAVPSAGQGGPSSDDYAHVAAFWRALRRFLRRTEEVARANGLTPQRYRLLVMIKGAADGSQRATVTRLCEELQLGQSTVTELVARSEDAGLLHRETSPDDARVVFLQLTEDGEQRLAAVVSELNHERQQLARLVETFNT
jgi:DNA-binding MarR family transcriptional regulator